MPYICHTYGCWSLTLVHFALLRKSRKSHKSHKSHFSYFIFRYNIFVYDLVNHALISKIFTICILYFYCVPYKLILQFLERALRNCSLFFNKGALCRWFFLKRGGMVVSLFIINSFFLKHKLAEIPILTWNKLCWHLR